MYKPVVIVLVTALAVGPFIIHSDDPHAPHRQPEYRFAHDQVLKISTSTSTLLSVASVGPSPITIWFDRS